MEIKSTWRLLKSKFMNAGNIYYPVSALVNAITSLVLGILIWRHNIKDSLYKSFTLFCISIAIWSTFYFCWQVSTNYHDALYYSRCLMFGAIFIPFFYFHHISILLNKSQQFRKVIVFGHVMSVVAFASCFTPLYVKDVVSTNGFKFWPVAGPLYGPFLTIWFCYVLGGVVLIWKAYLKSEGKQRNQLKYVLAATIIGWSGGATNYPLWFGVNVLPVGNILVAAYVIIVSYAIVRHNLLDIEVIIRRTAVFAGLFAFVYGIFTIFTVLGQELFKNSLHWNQWVAMVPTVLVITFALRPLEIFLTNATERFLFQKKYSYIELLRTFTNEILTVLDLQKLMDQTVAGLVKIIKLESACVLLFDKESKAYKLVAKSGVKEKEALFGPEDTLIAYLKASPGHIIKDKSVDKMDGHSALRDDFKRLNAQICLPISLHDELIGVLCVGMKKSGEDYTQEDIDILTTLARTEAIAISNAQLFDELSKTQAEAAQREKMAVIGTLAAGINHEICNPLGIVRGQCEMFLLNLRDGFYKEKSIEDMVRISSDIMTKVIKETDRATAITKKLSSFSKPSKRSEFEEVSVEKEAREVLDLIGHDLKLNNIDIQMDFAPGFPPILADRKQIEEVLFNIIRNAAQAMDKSSGKIAVSGFEKNGSAIIQIADNGSGIPADKLDQIFHPFYTTKAPGKGTGLGLFIVKQVVERNKGVITVESQVDVGTTFTLNFPSAVKALAVA